MSISVSVNADITQRGILARLRLDRFVERDIQRRTERVFQAARREAPTNSVAEGVRVFPTGSGRDHTGTVISTHPATVFIVNGTRPHVIRPVRARALRFTVGGRVVFAQVVHHPGTRANDFMARALLAAY